MRHYISCLFFGIVTTSICFAQNPPVIQWQNTIGGTYSENFSIAKQTPDGGYIISGASNSGLSGETSAPRMQQLRESASILNVTDSDKIRGCAFSIFPVEAEPVNVTTSWLMT